MKASSLTASGLKLSAAVKSALKASALVASISAPPPLLRFASPYNRTAGTTVTMGAGKQTASAFAPLLTIGSGNFKTLRPRLDNGYWTTSGWVATGNAVTYSDIWLVHNGISKQCTFNGQTTYTAADGEIGIFADPMSPADFGVSSFNIGVATAVRGIATSPIGGKLPFNGYSDTGNRGVYYDPAVTQVTNISAALTSASITTTGVAPTVSFGVPVVLVGEFVSGDPRTILRLADSFEERGTLVSGALLASLQAPMIAGCQAGRSGARITMALNSPEMVKSLMKHTNVDYDGFGTNSVNVNTALATMQQEERDYWALARSGASTHPQATPLQIWHPRLLTVVTGTYDTLAGQTVNPRYVQGELADQFWAWLQTQVGVAGGIDHVFDPWTGAGGTVRGSTDVNSVDYYKFAPNMTGDGTHVLAAGATIGGNNLRPVWDSFA